MAEPVKGVEERFAERQAELFGGPPAVFPLPIYVAAVSYIIGLLVPLAGWLVGSLLLLNREDSVQRVGKRTLEFATLGTLVILVRLLLNRTWTLTIFG